MKKWLIALLIPLSFQSVQAATINLSDCAQTTVNNAITAAASGDILVCPSGSWSWSDVNITKNITLQGAGIDSTNISITAAGGLESPQSYTGPFRVTGFTFTSTANFGTDSGFAMIRILANRGFRVDHNKFQVYSDQIGYNGGNAIYTRYDVWGVIDHNQFVNHPSQLTSGGCLHAMVYPEGNGTTAWALPSQLGLSDHTVFIEDNYFREAKQCSAHNPHASYGQRGGIYVFRHNTLRNFMCDSHGYEVIQSTRSWEFYNNDFIVETGRNLYRLIFMRGGTGVIYNNILTLEGSGSVTTAISLEEQRVTSDRGTPGRPELYGGVPGNTSCSAAEGYPCVDQIGRGQSVGTSPNMTQLSDPAYVWGNTFTGAGEIIRGVPSGYVNANRDYYYNQGAKPGYVAYPYPHPLVTGEPEPPPPPGNLIPNPPSITGVN